MLEWQPIETAPKPMVTVDLWVTAPHWDGRRYAGGLGRPVRRRIKGKRFPDYHWDDVFECWRRTEDLHFVNRLPEGFTPTHWAPIPKEPPNA